MEFATLFEAIYGRLSCRVSLSYPWNAYGRQVSSKIVYCIIKESLTALRRYISDSRISEVMIKFFLLELKYRFVLIFKNVM